MLYVVFFKQKTAYEMRISDWSSDVCSSDLPEAFLDRLFAGHDAVGTVPDDERAAAFVGADPVLRRAGFLEDIAGFDAGLFDIGDDERSEERRVGKECVSTCRYRWSQYHSNKTIQEY